jgi:5-methylcytosine-specific restriction endonuclease McrA
MQVFVLDKDRKPLDPTTPARARWLLKQRRAAVFRRFSFTIILKDRTLAESVVHEHRVKVDPGSRVTGVVVVCEPTARVVFAAEVEHRGLKIKAALDSRRALRRARRQRKTRYRKPRFDNRTRRDGWLPPSLESRVANVLTWVNRLRRLCPVTALSMELVRFDMQAMENPEVSGVEYQQGTLAGYEVREYLLEKWNRRCAYCGAEGVPLQIEHICPRSRGGTNRISNLALACDPCNDRKGNQPVEVFLAKKPDVLKRILAQAKAPLRDAAAVNATRWELYRRLAATGLPIECGSGGRTKYNRTRLGLPKTHWLDAACVGASTPDALGVHGVRPLLIKACGHGKRQRCGTDKYGFPTRQAPRRKYDRGFRTGDIVVAAVPSGKYRGRHCGRVAIRFGQSFQLGKASVHPRHLRVVHRADGYDYAHGLKFCRPFSGGALPPDEGGVAAPHA